MAAVDQDFFAQINGFIKPRQRFFHVFQFRNVLIPDGKVIYLKSGSRFNIMKIAEFSTKIHNGINPRCFYGIQFSMGHGGISHGQVFCNPF